MGYLIKLQILDKPKKQLAPAEQKAIELATEDAANFLVKCVEINTPVKSGKLRSSIRKLVFRIKGSAKVYYDLAIAPYAVEVMRGNKSPRVIEARGKALRFTIQGQVFYRKKVQRKRTFGLRIIERLRLNNQVNQTLLDIYRAHIRLALTGEQRLVSATPVVLGR